MTNNLKNCANCKNSKDDKTYMLWCSELMTGVYFNEVCDNWEWDEVEYSDRKRGDNS